MKQSLLVRWSVSGLAVPLAAAVLSGCASYRINTTLKPSGLPVSAPVQFNLADVRYVLPTNIADMAISPFNANPVTHAALRDDLMGVAMAAYPKTFSTASEAIPLSVTITCVENKSDMNEGATCVSCITLTIIPMMSDETGTYSVETRCGSESINQTLARPVSFKRTDVSWLSITPTGWIPVPAGQGDRVLGMDGAIAKAKESTLKACVEAVAANLRRVKPEAWSQAPAVK